MADYDKCWLPGITRKCKAKTRYGVFGSKCELWNDETKICLIEDLNIKIQEKDFEIETKDLAIKYLTKSMEEFCEKMKKLKEENEILKDCYASRMNALKLCPFCGGSAQLVSDDYDNLSGYCKWHVICIKCNASTKEYSTSNDAVTSWNNRV
jgi:Lar family restriction alleviation protein